VTSSEGGSRYTLRIAEGRPIAERVSYDELLKCVVEYILRASLARTIDQGEFEHEEVRCNGLTAFQISRDGKAIWADQVLFDRTLDEARRTGSAPAFEAVNELDTSLLDRIDRNLTSLWSLAGYRTPSLAHSMKLLFREIERDAMAQADNALEGFAAELLRAMS
jgi:hypothetical protein